MTQASLAIAPGPGWLPGFTYRPEFLGVEEESALAARIASLPFAEVRLRGQVARRRTVHFGWLYGYESRRVEPGPPLPTFLGGVRDRAAALAGVTPEALAEVLVTEYGPGAGIGWHCDAPMFGTVIGVSLLSPCRFRFRRRAGDRYETRTLTVEPRSAYVLADQARWTWQHSIPPGPALRYSITFRTVRRP